jgi:cytochrome P450
MTTRMSAEAIKIGSQFDPLGDDYLADPYPFMAEARDAAPVFYSQKLDHWIVTRYPLIRQVFLNPQIFSAANANAPLRPACPAAVKALEEGGFRAVPTLANVDPPAHTRVRRMANGAFTPARVSAMEDFIRDLVVRYCDERFRDEHADIVRDLAWELPVRVLFKILGIDEDRVAEIKEGSFNRILFVYGRTGSEAEQVRAAAGMATFWRYAEQLVVARTREPRDDFTSALVLAADERGERLSSQQSATVVLNLLFAGHETTTGILGNCLRRLLGDRAAWDAIRGDPASEQQSDWRRRKCRTSSGPSPWVGSGARSRIAWHLRPGDRREGSRGRGRAPRRQAATGPSEPHPVWPPSRALPRDCRRGWCRCSAQGWRPHGCASNES